MAGHGLLRRLFFLEQWCLGHAAIKIEELLANPSKARFTWIYPEGARTLLADPFGIERSGRLIILAEKLVYGRHEGRLVLIDAGTGNMSPLLVRPYHLSYPFSVTHEGETFIVPEQSESRHVSFYRLLGNRLEGPVAAIEGLDALDATFLHHGGRWWLFCARASAPADTLHLFFAERLFGPYHPHPANPVVRDPARARPAGRVIGAGGLLLRPGQDCRKSYGAAITLSEIEELSEARYRERPLQRLEPYLFSGGFAAGLHTLDHTEHHVLVDTKRFAFHPLASLFKIKDRLRRNKTVE